MLPATAAEFYGDGPIVLESEFKNVGYWNAANDYVAWSIDVSKSGDYDDMKSYGAYIFYRVGITPDGHWQFFVAGD